MVLLVRWTPGMTCDCIAAARDGTLQVAEANTGPIIVVTTGALTDHSGQSGILLFQCVQLTN